jgi:hypothetical protein
MKTNSFFAFLVLFFLAGANAFAVSVTQSATSVIGGQDFTITYETYAGRAGNQNRYYGAPNVTVTNGSVRSMSNTAIVISTMEVASPITAVVTFPAFSGSYRMSFPERSFTVSVTATAPAFITVLGVNSFGFNGVGQSYSVNAPLGANAALVLAKGAGGGNGNAGVGGKGTQISVRKTINTDGELFTVTPGQGGSSWTWRGGLFAGSGGGATSVTAPAFELYAAGGGGGAFYTDQNGAKSTGWDGGTPMLAQNTFLSAIEQGFSVPWADWNKRVQIASLTSNGTDWYGFNYQDKGFATYPNYLGYAGIGKVGGVGARQITGHNSAIMTSPLSPFPFGGGGATYGGGGGGGGGYVGGNGGSVRSGYGRKDGFHPVGYGGVGGVSQVIGGTTAPIYSNVGAPGQNGSASIYFYFDQRLVPLPATFTFNNTTQIYNGSPRIVTAVSTPAGVSHTITYNGSLQAPTLAGTYEVIATANQIATDTQPGYVGSSIGTLTVFARLNTAVASGQGSVTGGGGNYLPGNTAPINAIPATNWLFGGWSLTGTGASLGSSAGTASNLVTIGTTSVTAAATFNQIMQSLSVTIEPGLVGGVVTPAGITSVGQGNTVAITPSQTAANYYFDRFDLVDSTGTLISTLSKADDATPLPVLNYLVPAGPSFINAVYLPKQVATITLIDPVGAVSKDSIPFAITATASSSAVVSVSLRGALVPADLASLTGTLVTLTSNPRMAGTIPITLTAPETRTFLAATLDADIVIAGDPAPLTFTELSATRIDTVGNDVSANVVAQQIVNDYSLVQYAQRYYANIGQTPPTDLIGGYTTWLNRQDDPQASRAALTAQLLAAGVKTAYVVAVDKLIAAAATTTPPTGDTGGNPTHTGTASDPVVLTNLQGTAVLGTYGTYGGKVYLYSYGATGYSGGVVSYGNRWAIAP